MIFAPPHHRVVEHVDRRVLGAFQFVDAVTQFPVIVAARVEVRSATLLPDENVPLVPESVRLRQTRSGVWAIMRAPFFDTYAETFVNPETPDEVEGTSLRLRIAVTDAGPNYLPQEFDFDLPRDIEDDIFEPVALQLFRAPGAPVLGGWAVLRTRVLTAGGDPLGGVLVRVFRHPRQDDDNPIGQGMSDWRGDLRGEALVAAADIPRFRPGEEDEVLASTQAVQFEAARDSNFAGGPNELPDGPKIAAGTADGVDTFRSDLPADDPTLEVEPNVPLNLRAGQETTIELTLP
jgi:hypothetical protein